MKLARVVGTVTSTINVPIYDDRKLLLCDLVAPDGSPADGYLIAVDTVGAGAGETVLLMDEGNSARQILGATDAPVRAVIVGIVDVVEVAPGEEQAEPQAAAAPARPTRSRARAKPGPRPGKPAASRAEEPTRRPRRRRSA